MRINSLFAVSASAAAMVAFSAPAASAEGLPEQGPDHANSICSFSGLNDDPDAGFPEGGRVQSYGQLVRQKVIPPRYVRNHGPGTECNGHLMPYPEAFGGH
jgi:hypothetical protein